MQQNKSLFFVIIGLAVLAVVGMAVFVLFFRDSIDEISALQAATPIQVVVAPGIKPWVDDAARKFNAGQTNTAITVIAADELVPGTKFRPTGQPPFPAAWLAEADFVPALAARNGYRFDNPQSVAGANLAWGAYTDKLDAFTQEYGELTWENIYPKATGPDGFRLVIASPHSTAEGLAALASAAAARAGSNTLTADDIGSVDAWLTETLGNHNAQPRAEPAQTLASVQGRSIGDAGLLSTASWRAAKLDQSGQFTVLLASPNVAFTYPFTIWADAPPDAQKTAEAFRQFLLAPEQQAALAQFGFDPAGSAGTDSVQLDGDAVQRLLNWANRTFN
ncbi:MAG: hypothetical protein D6768_03015 [Chloroflexi bacterium]|nr:MAG: hypothetical protein D6768_03015 [Chloroflexota bacterium]